MASERNRRERRKAKAGGWARQPNPAGKVGHHASADPLVAYERPAVVAVKGKRSKPWRAALREINCAGDTPTLADVWPDG